MVYLKNNKEIEDIEQTCDIWKKVKEEICSKIKEGMTTLQINQLAKESIKKHNATASFLGYGGFPYEVCISVNEELIHGFPSKKLVNSGDMITIDLGITFKKMICDSAFTIIIGQNQEAERISKVTYKCLMEAIDQIKPGCRVGDISSTIEKIAQENGYEVIKDFTGHGCGIKLHEDPLIPCYGVRGTGPKIIPGMTLCIEPMLMTGSDEYYTEKNGWTIVSKNKKLTCHWEHMVLVTDNGYKILTL